MLNKPSLADQLAEYKAGFKSRVPPARVATMEAATAQLCASGISERARRPGDTAPDVSLPDALGRPVRLAELWRNGPLVVVFYRGGWCPYCNLTLRAWQQYLEELRGLGAGIVAISPQTPNNSMSTAEKNELAYPVLSDSRMQAAEAFGIGFSLPPELVELYASVGHDLPNVNGNGQWRLPLPATFVLDREGRIRFSHVEADYRERAEPAEVMAAVRSIARLVEGVPAKAVLPAKAGT
jgi:peroxiredoxin